MSINDDYYKDHYSKVLNSGLVGKVSDLTHVSLEKGFKHDAFYARVLELGAGEGQHLRFVKHGYDEYIQSDLRINNLIDKSKYSDGKVVTQMVDASNLETFEDDSVDRIIATCLLAHLAEPLKSLQDWRRVTRKNGRISIYVPCEPGVLLRVTRALSTARKASRYVDEPLIRHYLEHRNHYLGMNAAIKTAFKSDRIETSTYPTKLLSWNFSLWKVYTITVLKQDLQFSDEQRARVENINE